MPNQFNGFCYPTLDDAANADRSISAFSAANGLVVPASYTVVSTNAVNMTYTYQAFDAVPSVSYVLQRSYPVCVDVGQINNNSGISVIDAVTVSFMVVAVWAIAFYFKSLRTGVRGY